MKTKIPKFSVWLTISANFSKITAPLVIRRNPCPKQIHNDFPCVFL